LYEDVYMAQPPGFLHPQYPQHVCKLHKSIYGLRQAPRAWFSRLTNKLQAIGFKGSQADHSLLCLSTWFYSSLFSHICR
jgi:histone deacetylase 1/2